MFRSVFSILLGLLILHPTGIRVYILGDFLLNQEFIAEVLCINKDKPMLNCDGQCFLATQLKKAEEKERSAHHDYLNQNSKLSFFIIPQTVDTADTTIQLDFIDHFPQAQLTTYAEFPSDIFHPPPYYV
jgi:hypothetical protein